MNYNEFKENFLPEFLNINSYAGRMRYTKQHLPSLGSGTGRAVFDIDGEKVLKLAKNVKGVAQNEVEERVGSYPDTHDVVTKVFDGAEDNTWLISEKAKKVTEGRIKELTEIPSLNELRYFLVNYESISTTNKGKVFPQTKEMEDFFWENEFAFALANLVVNYSVSAGDMGRPSTYGEVIRDGYSTIVLTDYGLDKNVIDTHYTKKILREYFQDASGNDDFLSDIGGGQEIRNGITALEPTTVGDNDGSLNEVFPRDTGDAVAAEIGKNLGVNPQYLGAGTIGIAYDIGDEKVLKITNDNTEAYENKRLIGKQLNYIAQPYKVFQIQSKSNPSAKKMYGIILEKLKTDDAYFKRMMVRIEYITYTFFNVNYKEAIDEYIDNKFHKVDTNDVDKYFRKNPKDGEFFFSLVRIGQELKKYGIKTYDYFNYLNLGYKKSGLIGFFDVGFTRNEYDNEIGVEKMNVAEDATAKFSTDGDIGSDGFPVYNNNDTSPMISNDLNANSSMYNEDLEYNHVKGDATDDEYMLGEEVISYSSDGDYDDEGDYDLDDIMNQIDNIVRKSGINILSDKELSGYVLKDNVVAGAIFSSVGNDEYSFDVVVDDNFKRMGIGKELVQFGIDEFNDLSDVYEDLKLNLDVVNPYMRDLLKKYFNFKDVNKIGDDRYNMSMNERDKSFGSGSKTVKVKKKCKIGGLGNTSAACNQGDINNLEFGSIKEDNGDDSDLLGFSTINELENLELPENSGIIAPMNEEGNIMQLNDLPFKSAIEQEGGKIYSVGGAVRDEYLGKESKDLDILITGIPMDRLEFLLSKFGSVNEVGASFGVLKFVPEGSREEIDIAIPRTEVANAEGGHQGFDVTSDHNLPIEKDLERRDFTINAIGKDAEGNIIDPYNGQEDLKNKIIRVVNPDAFSDDPLRMLRAVQFASRFGFEIEPKTAQMIKDNAGRVKEISPERILIEFDKIVKKGDAYVGAYLLKALGLTPQIFGKDGGLFVTKAWSGVERMSEFIWLLSHHLVGNVAEFFKTGLKGDTDSYKELKALKFAYDAAEESDIVKRRTAMHNVFVTSNAMLGSKILPESLRVAANELMTGRYPKTLGELAINGNDLMNRGLKGKEIGDMLKYLLVQIYSDNVDNNEKELSTLIDKKNKSIQEGYGDYYMSKPTWRINDKIVGINFFVEEYDKWNNQNGTPAYPHATRASVLEFLQNNYEDESTNEDINKMLYWALTDRDVLNEDGEEMKKVNYSAVVLDDSSRTKLLQLFKPMIPEGWEVIAHHMTIKLGALEVGSDAEKDMASGKVINLKAIDYAYDDLVMAVGVEGYETKNQKPHITIAVNREAGGKPYLSNKLKDWKSLGFNLELTGKISEE